MIVIPADIGGLGSPAQIGTFVVVAMAAMKLIIPWRQQTLDHKKDQVASYKETCEILRKEVSEMMAKVKACEEDCASKVTDLQNEIFGLRRQHVQEQLSLINAIISSVGDNPALKQLMKTFESVQIALNPNVIQFQTGTVLQDEDKADDT